MAIFRGTGGAGDASANVTINQVTEKALEAEASATAAASSASSAASSASNASTSATNAATSATNAATSATSASTSATTASTAATAAQTAQTAAETAQTAAETAQTAAETAETNAETAETNAESAQAYAEEWATKAEDSLISTAAGGDGSTDYSALHHAAKAATSETNAATSETNASNSATSASNSATASANSATAAATSATSASNSASAAATSATSAASSAASAASALDNFDDRYLGSYASDPATDNDGDPLVVGALYFNSADGVMKVYTASGWIAASSASVATMTKFNFTATGGQTVFSGADDNTETLSLTVGAEMVTLNGVVLEQGTDYTATSSAITLTTGATASDELNVYAFGNFQVADTVSASTGGTFTGAVTFDGGANFGDNDKAIFGAGSDLQIYHDGSNSYITDVGAGTLRLQGATSVAIQTTGGNNMAQFVNNGAVNLFHNANQKLATTSTGIDVTGTVTADGLTVDGGNTIRLNASSSDDFLTIEQGTSDAKISAKSTAGNANLQFFTTTVGTTRQRMDIATNGDISFYEDTGTTPKFFWDASAESLGIGTSSPSRQLSVFNSTGDANVTIRTGQSNSGNSQLMFGDAEQDNTGRITYAHVDNHMRFQTNGSEAMRIDSSGNVGIGVTNPSSFNADANNLVVGSGTGNNGITIYGNSAGFGGLYFADGTLTNQAKTGYINYDYSNEVMAFHTSGAEKMRIDSSGNLRFNSGYGSVATAYGCRAWVNFNGTGTPAARGSGNISTISDEGTGQYGVNFTTAMPDANYNFVGATNGDNTNGAAVYKDNGISATTTNIRIRTKLLGNQNADRNEICVSFFR